MHPSVRYALTDADQLAYAWRRHLRVGGWAVVLVAAAFVAVALVTREARILGAAPVVLAPWTFGWVVAWVVQRGAVLARLRRNLLHGLPLELTLRPHGLELAIPERTIVPWSLVGRPRLGRAALEIPVQRQRWLVPRRAFATPEEARAFAAAIVAVRSRKATPASTDWPWAAPPELDAAWRTSFSDHLTLNRWLVRRPGSRNVNPSLGAHRPLRAVARAQRRGVAPLRRSRGPGPLHRDRGPAPDPSRGARRGRSDPRRERDRVRARPADPERASALADAAFSGLAAKVLARLQTSDLRDALS